MQQSNSGQAGPGAPEITEDPEPPISPKSSVIEDEDVTQNAVDESILDVSGKSLGFSLPDDSDESVNGLYLYKNVFNLLPKSVGGFGRLKTVKFFGNEINLFPAEFEKLVGLECLQVKISSPGLNGLDLRKLQGLRELELSKVLPRPSAFPILSEIAGLKGLTKLSVCYFSIRYLPPEIGCLNKLEYLDLSFNKMKSLPTEIKYLNALITLKVANNKLVELPAGLSSLQRLKNLDFSNNRLSSLDPLELGSMPNLQNLNLQYNKLVGSQIPSWICCNLDGNDKSPSDDIINSSVEMDVYEVCIQDKSSLFCNGSDHTSPSLITGPSSSNRCFATRRSGKRWKRRYYLQQRARQERLNNSRKWKGEDPIDVLTLKASEGCQPSNLDIQASETCKDVLDIVTLEHDDKESISADVDCENLPNCVEDDEIDSKNCSCAEVDSVSVSEDRKFVCDDASLALSQNSAAEQNGVLSSETSGNALKPKRHGDEELDNPKPCKSRKSTIDCLDLSSQYSNISFCGTEDHLPDGFYDAGRDRPFMPLRSYEDILHLDSREVILVDRNKDEELDAIVISAQAIVSRLKQLNGVNDNRVQVIVDSLQVASLLALFVSDHFGGSDRNNIIERTRKAASGSNYLKPFVCTCSTGNLDNSNTSTKQVLDTSNDIVFAELCEKSLRSIKGKHTSIVVPIGTLQFGVCRHRAILLKYLCDRMEPPVPCELVRGYLDFQPHAWNVILVKRGNLWVRMVVDACRPHDIREESDPEFACRYIPLNRTDNLLSSESSIPSGCSFPSLSSSEEIERVASSSLFQCKLGSVESAVKVRTLETAGRSVDEMKNFEYTCLGEVRILRTLKHPCIVEIYGHQLSSKWVSSEDGNKEHRILKSAIFMEYVKGGSLKSYVRKLFDAGETHVPVELAMYIARDVAFALSELHSRHIIHRDIKSENILIDLDGKRDDTSPLVKLCDFDRAVPLRSYLHTCCIAHTGIPPPDTCVGTPRWMAPEVLRAMHKRNMYGLEVDIWSYGCLLLELLTLQVPYSGLSESHIQDLLQNGKRPPLSDELEGLDSLGEPEDGTEPVGEEVESGNLRFLVDLFRRCTVENPQDRPSAEELYTMLVGRTGNFATSKK